MAFASANASFAGGAADAAVGAASVQTSVNPHSHFELLRFISILRLSGR
jgi:hypothetical protein